MLQNVLQATGTDVLQNLLQAKGAVLQNVLQATKHVYDASAAGDGLFRLVD